jgi:CRP-like cAMP-binding protein
MSNENKDRQAVKQKIEKYFSQHQLLNYHKGEVILRANDIPSGISYLKSGVVRLYTLSPEGEELTLHAFRPGSFFPASWALQEQANKHYYEALNDVTLYRAPTKAVLGFILDNPDVHFDLTTRLMIALDGFSIKLEHLVFDRAVGKTSSLLLYLADQFGKEDSSEVTIQLPFTHDNLASWLGMTRVSISQAMTKLKKRKLISYRKGLITIKDRQKLSEVR